MKETLERIKIILKDIRINTHDIDVCYQFNDFEDLGFYTSLRSDLEKELIETITKYIEEVEGAEDASK